MGLRSVNAITRCDLLEQVDKRLKDMLVKGLSVSHVKGYGE
jgi:nitrogen regulatory protein PII